MVVVDEKERLMDASERVFSCDESGYIRHWILAGTYVAKYEGPPGSDNELRASTVDATIELPPENAALGTPGPRGETWTYYDPGANIFVERSSFYHDLSVLNLYGATDLAVVEDCELKARFWSCGASDLWVNGEHVSRHNVPQYMYPDATEITIPLRKHRNDLETTEHTVSLKKGRNRLCVRLQAFGVRDTRVLYGIQILEGAEKVGIVIPGEDAFTGQAIAADRWLNNIRADGRDALCSGEPAPFDAVVKIKGEEIAWPEGTDRVVMGAVARAEVQLVLGSETLKRVLELPLNQSIAVSDAPSLEAHQAAILRDIANRTGRGRDGVMPVLARHTLGERNEEDEAVLFESLDWIDGRPDCADFPLAAFLRLYHGNTLTQKERDRIKETVLDFRYWHDEPGNDAMCFDSENHSLLFHGCQMIAGNLFPDEIFTNSGRTGKEQVAIGKDRCEKWLDEIEARGFREFLSSTYMPLTCAAVLNLVDYADEVMSKRAAKVVDGIFEMLAMHAFDGVTVGPQGRVYRGVLNPEMSGTQAMLVYASKEAVMAHNDWLSFVGASQTYRLPKGMDALIQATVSKKYRQASVEIQLEKTAGFLLTSLQLPASFQKPQSKVDPAHSARGLIPGRQGYQQHLWHATLSRDCHVFVNHPGASFDMSSSRPGFWYGNGILPHTVQAGATVMQVFDIPDWHPISFTHAHWPTDIFDRQIVEGHWAFGKKGNGCVALWCSEALTVCSEVLTDRELRANGQQVAWVGLCGRGDLDAFAASCRARQPEFDAASLALSLDGKRKLTYEGVAV
ncbi:MAG: hypothetical protein ACI8V2_004152 [Candidatus Latescibacterota bacterium]